MEDVPCLLDVISDPDALNLFLNDEDDDQVADRILPLVETATSVLTATKPAATDNPPTPCSKPGATFLSPQRTGKVMPSASAFLQQQVAQSNTQYVLSGSPSPRGVLQAQTPGSSYTLHHSSTPSPATLPSRTPSPMPSPATTPNTYMHQPLTIVNSNVVQQQTVPQVQTQLVLQGQKAPVLTQLQNVHRSVHGQPRVQILPQLQASSTSLQLAATGMSLSSTTGGQIVRAPQLFQTSSGNKIILQGQPLLAASNPQQYNLGSVSGIQLQSPAIAVNPQHQVLASGTLQNVPGVTAAVSQSPCIQAPPNINIMSLQTQTRPQQVIIQQGAGGVGGKQNLLLTTLGNNMVRVAGGTPPIQTGMLINQNQSQVLLTKGSQSPVVVHPQMSGIQTHQSQPIQLTGLKTAGQIQLNNPQGQIINVQQNPQTTVIQNNVNIIGGLDGNAAQQVKPAGTHIININGRAVTVNAQQIQQLLALQQQKVNQQNLQAVPGQSVQIVQNVSLPQAVTATSVGKVLDSNNPHANATNAAVQQHLQEIQEKLAQQKRQQGLQIQSTPQPGVATPTTSGLKVVNNVNVSSQGNVNQVNIKATGLVQSGATIPQLGAVNVAPATGPFQQAVKPLGMVEGSVQTVVQQNQPGYVQFQRTGVQNTGTNGNVVTLQTIVQPTATSKQVTHFRQILPSTSQVCSSASSILTASTTTQSTIPLPGGSPSLAKAGSAPNVNVQKMGIGTQQLSKSAQVSHQPQLPLSLQSSVTAAHLLPGLNNSEALSRLTSSSSGLKQTTMSIASFSNPMISSSSTQNVSNPPQTFLTSGAELVNSLGVSNIVSGAPQNGPVAQLQVPQGHVMAGQPNMQVSDIPVGGIRSQQSGVQLTAKQIGARPQSVNVQQQSVAVQQPLLQQQVLPPQQGLTQPCQQSLQAISQLSPVTSNISQTQSTAVQPQPGVSLSGIQQPTPSSQTVGIQGRNPQMNGQQVITQQITIQQPGQPGSSRVVTIQLTPQIQHALMIVQHKIKILLAVQHKTEAQSDELRQLAEAQQKIIYYGRNQALRSQQAQNIQQPVQQQLPGPSNVSSTVVSQAQTAAAIFGVQPSVQPQAISQNNVIPVSVVPLVTTANSVASDVTTTFATSVMVSSAEGVITPGQDICTETKITDINQLPAHMKEKLRQQLAKLTPSQLDYFLKNQATILAKLVKQHQESTTLQKEQQQIASSIAQQPIASPPTQLGGPPIDVKTEPGSNTLTPIAPSVGNPVQISTVTVPSIVKTEVVPTVSALKPVVTVVKPTIKLTRKQVFQHYVTKDQKKVEEPDYTQPFQSRKDILKRLLVYHTCQVKQDKREDIFAGEELYEETAKELLDRKNAMFRKYQLLLLQDSMKHERTAEMVMLDRMFLASERENLAAEKEQAAEDPESFVPTPMFYSSDEDEDHSSLTDRRFTDSSPSSPTKHNYDMSGLSPVTPPEEYGSKLDEVKQLNDTSTDVPPSPGNNYTLHSSRGLKLVFKSSPSHQTGSPSHVTENFSVKSEDSGISSQQNSVETVEDGAPARKRVRYSSEEKDVFRTNAGTSEVINKPTQSTAKTKGDILPFTSYKEENSTIDTKQDSALDDMKMDSSTDWMFPDSPKSNLKELGLSECDSAVAGLLGSDMLADDLGAYNGGLLDDMTLEEHLSRSLEETVLPEDDNYLDTGNAPNIAPQYDYISEVSDYETDTNLGEKDQELEGALGGLLSDMEQDGKDYPSELAFNNQSDPYTPDQTSQSDSEEQNSTEQFGATMSMVPMGETQSAIDSLLALESPNDFNYDEM